jgi:hypothetical protein
MISERAAMDTQISGGFLATLIIVPILLIIFIGGGIQIWRYRQSGLCDPMDKGILSWLLIADLGAILAIVTLTAFSMYPYKWEYHSWREISGIVNTVDSRLIAGEQSTNQKFVVTFMGHEDDQYGVDDTRMAGIRTGSRLTITCKREFQFRGSDGWNCNFVRVEKAQ